MGNLIILTIIVLSFVIFAIFKLISITKTLNIKINNIEFDANEAKTTEELEIVWDNLKIINKQCWHRTFGTRLFRIKTFIETKHRMLNKL